MTHSAAKIVGVIVYGLVAGFAATTVSILGPIFIALFFFWIFNSLGWKQASDMATAVISLYIFIVGLGLTIGIVVCIRVWIIRLRSTPTP